MKTVQPWTRFGRILLVAAVLVGGALRFYDLSGPSFSDDEVFKVNAVEHYRHGRFVLTADDEHPLVMKLLIWGSVAFTDRWNAHVARGSDPLTISMESAVRAPNALVGALMAILIAFLGRELFSRRVGLLAALLWAIEVNAIGFNRIAKEDTLLAAFLCWAFYFALRAKRAAEFGDAIAQRRAERNVAITLGLLMASKYFLHMALTVPLFYFWVRRDGSPWHVPARRWGQLLGIGALTFVIVNPTLFHPRNLAYIVGFVEHKTIYTHGYLFMGQLFMNQVFEGSARTPWYFYFVFLGVKLPIATLMAVAAGIGALAARRKSDGARVFAVWSGVWMLIHAFLAGGKFTRYVTHLLPLVVLLAGLGIDGFARAFASLVNRPARAGWTMAALSLLVLIPSVMAAHKTAPHYKINLNALGGPPERLRHFFPHCDFYDVGLREAVQYACSRADQGAQFRSDAHVAVRYYVQNLCKRPDIVVTTLSEPTSACQDGRACYHFVQIGRTYYETEKLFADLHARRPPDAVVRVEGVDVAEVYGPDNLAHHAVKLHTTDDARGAGALERHEPLPSTMTALRLSRNTVVEELFLPPAP